MEHIYDRDVVQAVEMAQAYNPGIVWDEEKEQSKYRFHKGKAFACLSFYHKAQSPAECLAHSRHQ